MTKTIGIFRVSRNSAAVTGVVCARITSGAAPTSSVAYARMRSGFYARKANVNSDCTFSPSKLLETLSEGCDVGLHQWVIFGEAHKHTDTRHALTVLSARRERPRRGPAKQRDELTAAA